MSRFIKEVKHESLILKSGEDQKKKKGRKKSKFLWNYPSIMNYHCTKKNVTDNLVQLQTWADFDQTDIKTYSSSVSQVFLPT